MKKVLYPLSVAAAVLGIFGAFFASFYVIVHLTTFSPASPMIVDPIQFTSQEALIACVWLVLGMAAVSGLILSFMLPLYLDHLTQIVELTRTRPRVEVVEVERALSAAA